MQAGKVYQANRKHDSTGRLQLVVIPMATRALRVSEHMLPRPRRPLVSPTVWEQSLRQRPSAPPDRAAARPTAVLRPLHACSRGAGGPRLRPSVTRAHAAHSVLLNVLVPGAGNTHVQERRAPRWRERAQSGLPAYGPHCPPTLTLCPGAALWALLQCTLAPMSGRVTSFQASCNPSVPPSPGTLWPQKCPPPGTLASFSPPTLQSEHSSPATLRGPSSRDSHCWRAQRTP